MGTRCAMGPHIYATLCRTQAQSPPAAIPAAGRPPGIGRGNCPGICYRGRAMAESIPMTRAGAEAIKRELKKLKSVDRPKNVHDIAVAREHGDLRENAEYHAAKERQSHLDGRSNTLADRLARAPTIDVSKLPGQRGVC